MPRPLVLSRPVTALVTAKVGNSAVLVADRAVVLGTHDDGTFRLGDDATKIFIRQGAAIGLAGQVGYVRDGKVIGLREEALTAHPAAGTRAAIQRLFTDHAEGIYAVPGVQYAELPELSRPVATIAVVATERGGLVEVDVVGLAEDGLAYANSLVPFGGGAYAPTGPVLDALQQDLARLGANSSTKDAVTSLAQAIRATAHHAKGGVTPTLDAAIVRPGHPIEVFTVPFPDSSYSTPGV